MQILFTICAVCSLAFAAGLNGFMTLTFVAVLACFHNIDLAWPLVGITPKFIFAILIPVTLLEIWFNKIPLTYRMNDWLQALIRPLIAIVLALAITGVRDGWLLVPITFTAFVAGFVHAMRIMFRSWVAVTTHGVGVPIMSAVEDLLAAVLACVAMLAPVISLAFAVLSGYLLIKLYCNVRRRALQRQLNAKLAAVETAATPMPKELKLPETRT